MHPKGQILLGCISFLSDFFDLLQKIVVNLLIFWRKVLYYLYVFRNMTSEEYAYEKNNIIIVSFVYDACGTGIMQ